MNFTPENSRCCTVFLNIDILYRSSSKTNKNSVRHKLLYSFMKFAGIGLAVSAVFFALCEAVTPVFIRLFYPSLAERTQPILTVVTLSQILAMLSAYLFIVVLTFTGEIWQLILQCCHLGLVLVLISVMTKRGGLTGFSAGVLLANLARVAVVLALGVVRAEKNPEAGDA